jgi:cyclase
VRTLRPAENIYAFYEGRGEGEPFSAESNWVDEEIDLGIASYAILDREEALVYDTHLSVGHAEVIRLELERAGARRFTVVLSHWHLDHIAGTAAFAGCDVIATARTAQLMERHREAIEGGTSSGPPAIDPLVMPTRTFEGSLKLTVGGIEAEVFHVNIHSDDGAPLWLPAQRILLAGDTLEDTVTYVDEPEAFDLHLADLDRLFGLGPERILPAHGDPDVIAAGGYPVGFITAAAEYTRALQRMVDEPQLREVPLRELLAGPLEAGWIHYHEPYEAIHRQNIERTLKQAGAPPA